MPRTEAVSTTKAPSRAFANPTNEATTRPIGGRDQGEEAEQDKSGRVQLGQPGGQRGQIDRGPGEQVEGGPAHHGQGEPEEQQSDREDDPGAQLAHQDRAEELQVVRSVARRPGRGRHGRYPRARSSIRTAATTRTIAKSVFNPVVDVDGP